MSIDTRTALARFIVGRFWRISRLQTFDPKMVALDLSVNAYSIDSGFQKFMTAFGRLFNIPARLDTYCPRCLWVQTSASECSTATINNDWRKLSQGGGPWWGFGAEAQAQACHEKETEQMGRWVRWRGPRLSYPR